MRPLVTATALTAVAVLAAGCNAPGRPLEVGFKEVPSDVVLGAQTSPTPVPSAGGLVPLPPVLPPPPSVVALPPPPFDVSVRPPAPSAPPLPTTPAGETCPDADPLQAPALEAPPTIAQGPARGQYVFRTDGRFEVSGADARRGRFPETSLRTVSGTLALDDGSLVFDVAELLGDVTTTTSYRVVPTSDLPPTAAAGAGLYVARVTSRSSDGQTSVFTPAPELKLAALPLVRGAVVEARGVDPTTATTMSFTSTVAGKARVDACGDPLDAFVLELTAGRLLSPISDLEFAATYAVGTQFGGLVLRDTVAFAGTDAGAGVSRTSTGTISSVPARP